MQLLFDSIFLTNFSDMGTPMPFKPPPTFTRKFTEKDFAHRGVGRFEYGKGERERERERERQSKRERDRGRPGGPQR